MPKADPEAMALRARPARPIRFRRGVIVGAAALGSVGLVATAWVALKPPAFRIIAPAEEVTPAAVSPDALGSLPATYADVPKLGPPLPGDLGRPILEHQRAASAVPSSAETDTGNEAARLEQERRRTELRAARESALLVQTSVRPVAAGDPAPAALQPQLPAAGPSPAAADIDRDPNAQQRKLAFVSGGDTGATADPHSLGAAPSPWTLSAGSVIAASLITGLRSDLPGLVVAQVTERVFDSATGRTLLIPQGSRLVGSYDSVVAFGQRRALVVWQRIILPDGRSLRIDNVPATDPAGYAGLADQVDFHSWSLLRGIALSTLLGVGSSLTFTGESDLVQAIRESTQQNVSRAGDQITSRNLQVQPTITIRPGAPVRLVVHRDLVLAPWYKQEK